MSLQTEIDRARSEIRTDGYAVSIGEWISIYEKGEMDVHPEFQRFFRWTQRQKSRLIESILLGIPIPQVFVAQRADGVWDVVDGLQRLSTIFEFVGVLRDEHKKLLPAFVLDETKYLPSLGGMSWDTKPISRSFSQAQRLLIKRAKIDVTIIQKESDANIKYELFQRLNTGGSQLSDQELRNSLLVMLNPEFYRWLRRLGDNKEFIDCVALSERAIEEQYDLELVLRFLTFRAMPASKLVNLGELGDYLTDKATEFAKDKTFDRSTEEEAFKSTFASLSATLGSDSFRRYDKTRDRFVGGFSVSAFEVVALGIGFAHQMVSQKQTKIAPKVQAIWNSKDFLEYSGSGIRAGSRIPRLVPLGRKLFGK